MAAPSFSEKSLEEIFRESLLPAIEDNRVEEVRTILQSCSRHDSQQQEHGAVRGATCSVGCDSDGGKASDNAAADGDGDKQRSERSRQLVNLICRESQKSALLIALEWEHFEIARDLLHHGADPNFEWRIGSVSEEHTPARQFSRSCLDLAVGELDNVEMVEALILAGAEVKSRTWESWSYIDWRDTKIKREILHLLYGRTRTVPTIPISFMIKLASDMKFEDVHKPSVRRVLRNVRWYISGEDLLTCVSRLSFGTEARFLLRLPAVGLVQHYTKSFYLQSLLLDVVKYSFLLPDPKGLLTKLLRQRVSIHGWTNKHAMVMQRAWHYLKLHPEMWEQDTISEGPARRSIPSYRISLLQKSCISCLSSLLDPHGLTITSGEHNLHRINLPECNEPLSLDTSSEQFAHSLSPFCILPAVVCHATDTRSEYIQETMLSHTKVKWLEDPGRIPVFNDGVAGVKLHNGPTCSDHVDLSAEQKKVSLAMCTCSGAIVQSLMSLCRDVITTACLEHTENVFFAVDSLPLPHRLKCSMLGI